MFVMWPRSWATRLTRSWRISTGRVQVLVFCHVAEILGYKTAQELKDLYRYSTVQVLVFSCYVAEILGYKTDQELEDLYRYSTGLGILLSCG